MSFSLFRSLNFIQKSTPVGFSKITFFRTLSSNLRLVRRTHSFGDFPQGLPLVKSADRTLQCFTRCVTTQTKIDVDADRGRTQTTTLSLDRALYRLDNDVKRTGRIYKQDVLDIYHSIQHIGGVTSTQAMLMIRCCGSFLAEAFPEERTHLVNSMWKTFEQIGAPLDISHYNALLKVYLENEHKFSPVEFLSSLQAKQVEPNRVTFQRLIARYCQDGDIQGAGSILEHMKSANLPINENVFNSLITGHGRSNDMESALGVLDIMRSAQLEPSSDTYAALLCAFAEKGDMENIDKYLADAKSHNVSLLDKDLLDVVYSLASSGHAQHVEQIIAKLTRSIGYNQDTFNTILHLVNKGHIDVGYQLLLTMRRGTMPSGDPAPVGHFFLKQLVRTGASTEKLIELSEDMEAKQLNTMAVTKVAECALIEVKPEIAVAFLRKMREKGLPVRTHYFWPLLLQYGKQGDKAKTFEILKAMVEMGCPGSFETLADYVLPYMGDIEPLDFVDDLQGLGYPLGPMVSPLLSHLLYNKELVQANKLVLQRPCRVLTNQLIRPLAFAFSHTNDMETSLSLLQFFIEHTVDVHETDYVGQFVLDYVQLKKNEGLEELLTALERKRLLLSATLADEIREQLKGSLSKRTSLLLDGMSTTELRPPPREEDILMTHPRDMSVDELESLFIEMRNKNMNTRGVLRHLLLQHCRLKNKERAVEIKKELDMMSFRYSGGMYAMLVEMACYSGDLELAEHYYNQLVEYHPNFVLDFHKIINLSALMAERDKTQDAINLMAGYAEKLGDTDVNDYVQPNLFRLFNVCAEKGNVRATKVLMDIVFKKELQQPTNMLMGCLVKAHIKNNDSEGAFAAFKEIAAEHRVTPWKNELFRLLIEKEDVQKLQEVKDISSKVHGEINTLFDLAFAFIECGKIPQAKKIIETPGLRARNDRLTHLCEFALKNGKTEAVEQLVKITRDLPDCDRDLLYYNLLRDYRKTGNYQKALGIWMSMQEENVQPTDRTLRYIGNILQEHDQPVPFDIPPGIQLGTTPAAEKHSQTLMSYILEQDLPEALKEKERMQEAGESLSIKDYSSLLELIIHNEDFAGAVELTNEMLDKDLHPHIPVFKFLMNRLSAQGEVDHILQLKSKLSEELQSRLMLQKCLNIAYVNSGRYEECLQQFESFPENAERLGGILFLLKKFPEQAERVKELAKTSQPKFYCVLWQHYMLNEQYSQADELEKEYPQLMENLYITPVCKAAKERGNSDIVINVLDRLENRSTDKNASAIALSYLIGIHCDNNDLDAAVNVLENKVEQYGVDVTMVRRGVLRALKRLLEQEGREIPSVMTTFPVFSASMKDIASSTSSSSSSSSSDEELSDSDK